MAFRTKKISQMDPKGSNLASTDLLEISELVSGSYVTKSITGAEIIASVPPTSVDWGDIGGTLSAQTDLNTALSGKVPTTRTLTINGTTQDLSADRTFTISTGITIGTTAITSGTVGRVMFEGTGNVVQESANMTFDNSTGAFQLTTTADNIVGLRLKSTTGQLKVKPYLNSTYGVLMESRNDADSALLPMTLSSSKLLLLDGNVIINSTSDAGFKVDINGTARVSGNLTLGAEIFGPATTYFNGPTINTGTLNIRYAQLNLPLTTVAQTLTAGSLTVGGGANATSIVTGTGVVSFRIANTTSSSTWYFENNRTAPSGSLEITNSLGSAGITLFTTRNVGINTNTDAGFKLDVNGTARVQGDVTVTGTRISISYSGMSIDANVATGYYNIRNNSGSASTTAITLGGNTYLNIYQPISASSGITAGTLNTITTPLTYAWASGTASPNLFQLNPNYNFTGTYTGTARGFYYNPTLTSIVGLTHFAFHSTSGRIRFQGLPTSSAGLSVGDIWNDAGTLKIV